MRAPFTCREASRQKTDDGFIEARMTWHVPSGLRMTRSRVGDSESRADCSESGDLTARLAPLGIFASKGNSLVPGIADSIGCSTEV